MNLNQVAYKALAHHADKAAIRLELGDASGYRAFVHRFDGRTVYVGIESEATTPVRYGFHLDAVGRVCNQGVAVAANEPAPFAADPLFRIEGTTLWMDVGLDGRRVRFPVER